MFIEQRGCHVLKNWRMTSIEFSWKFKVNYEFKYNRIDVRLFQYTDTDISITGQLCLTLR